MSLSLIQQFHALAGSGRFAEALDLFADDAVVEFHGPQGNPLAGRHAGRAAIERFFGLIGTSFEVEQFAAHEFIDAGNKVVVLGRERSRVRATGRVFDVPWAQVWRVRDGRIAALTDFFDTGSMALALAPSAYPPRSHP
jgi:hypothetical protein